MKMKDTKWMLCLLEAILVAIALWQKSLYLLTAGISGLWLCFWRLRWIALRGSGETRQAKGCKLAGLWLLLPSFSIAAVSAMQLWRITERPPHILEMVLVCGAVAGASALRILSLVQSRKESGVAVQVFRYYDFSSLAVSLAVLVSQLLWSGAAEEWPGMVCLTGCVMAGLILLLGSALLLRAMCNFASIMESVRMVKQAFQKKQRTFHFAKVGKDAFLLLLKLGMSIVSQSFFMFSNALFTGSMGIARYVALRMEGKDHASQLRLYRSVGWILSLAGLAYVTYSIRLFFGGTPGNYGQIMAIAIAFYTFLEFGVQVADLIRLRKKHDLEAEALRLISFCSILVSFVLTQSALMSSSSQGEHAFTDGLAGVFFGGLVVLVGAGILIRCHRFHEKTPS